MIKRLRHFRLWRCAMYALTWSLMLASSLSQAGRFAVREISTNCGVWWAMVQQVEAKYRK